MKRRKISLRKTTSPMGLRTRSRGVGTPAEQPVQRFVTPEKRVTRENQRNKMISSQNDDVIIIEPEMNSQPESTQMRLLKDDLILSQQSDGVLEVGWDCHSPDALRQASRLTTKMDIADIAQILGEETGTSGTPPLLGLWMQQQAPNPRVLDHKNERPVRNRRGRPAGVKASVTSKELLIQLACQIREQENQPDIEVPREEQKSPGDNGSDDLFDIIDKISPPGETPFTEINTPVRMPHRETPNRRGLDTSGDVCNKSAADIWDDSGADDDSFLIRATQDVLTSDPFQSPRFLLKRHSTSTPEVNANKKERHAPMVEASPTSHHAPAVRPQRNVVNKPPSFAKPAAVTSQGSKPFQSYSKSAQSKTISNLPAKSDRQVSQVPSFSTSSVVQSCRVPYPSSVSVSGSKPETKSVTQQSVMHCKPDVPSVLGSANKSLNSVPNNASTVSASCAPVHNSRAVPSVQSDAGKVKTSYTFSRIKTTASTCSVSSNSTVSSSRFRPPSGTAVVKTVSSGMRAPAKAPLPRQPPTTAYTKKPTLKTSDVGKKSIQKPYMSRAASVVPTGPSNLSFDCSLTDELLASLAEPDDLLDSQMMDIVVAETQLSAKGCDTETPYQRRKDVDIKKSCDKPVIRNQTQNRLASNTTSKCTVTSQRNKPSVAAKSFGSSGANVEREERDKAKAQVKEDSAAKTEGSENKLAETIADDDGLCESELLAVLENIESQSCSQPIQSSSGSDPSNSQERQKLYSAEQIEKKRQEALKRRQARLRLSQGTQDSMHH